MEERDRPPSPAGHPSIERYFATVHPKRDARAAVAQPFDLQLRVHPVLDGYVVYTAVIDTASRFILETALRHIPVPHTAPGKTPSSA